VLAPLKISSLHLSRRQIIKKEVENGGNNVGRIVSARIQQEQEY
jgi:hypothetical protein